MPRLAFLLLLTVAALSGAAAQAAVPVGAIMAGIPIWVYPLFALLVYLGLQARHPREVALPRRLLTPLLFLGWGLASVALRPETALLLDWTVWALASAALGTVLLRRGALAVGRAHDRVLIPGSWLPLVRNLLIFSAKFGLAIAAATHPQARAELAWWDIAVSGASAGYFIAWLGWFAAQYRRAVAA